MKFKMPSCLVASSHVFTFQLVSSADMNKCAPLRNVQQNSFEAYRKRRDKYQQ